MREEQYNDIQSSINVQIYLLLSMLFGLYSVFLIILLLTSQQEVKLTSHLRKLQDGQLYKFSPQSRGIGAR